MTKDKKHNLFKMLYFISIMLGVLSCAAFLTFPIIKWELPTYAGSEVNLYSGIGMIIGGDVTLHTTTIINQTTINNAYTIEKPFNTIAFIALLLLCTGILSACFISFMKSLNKNKLIALIPMCLILAGGIFALTIRNSFMNSWGIHELVADGFKLGYGTIIAGASAIISGLIGITASILKK